MSADRDPIEDLLSSISDGHHVDWEAKARGAGPEHRARLDSLREIARIAEFNRGLQAGGADAGMPERWGELLLLERIGRGARADVFRAWDPALQREVALKLLHDGVDGSTLLDEGRAAARIRHPHVVAVHGIDRRDGRVGLWMELVRGVDLEREVAARGPLPVADAIRLGGEIGSALVAVHAAGLLHRDVKPANVVRDAAGRHVLADFGLGLRWDGAALTAAGVSGTPMYMAPEVLAGGEASERSDVYALGALLWFALAGRHPYDVATLEALTRAAAAGTRRPLREARSDTPPALAAIVERAMAPEPAARFATARDFVAALAAAEAAPASSSVSARPTRRRGLALVAVAGVLVAVAVVWLAGERGRRAAAPASVPQAGTGATGAPVPPPAAAAYAVEATLLRRDARGAEQRLAAGDRVRPGDRLSLEFRATRPAFVYVLNEDERGERYLLFPQPLFDTKNPLAADTSVILPGAVKGKENAWTVTSAGGRERFLIVASPDPVAELEAELGRLPAPRPGRPVTYAAVGEPALERLRGVGGVVELPARPSAPSAPRPSSFDRFRALAGRETGVQGVWVRQVELDNP